jgi:hypothetical protein
MLVESLTGYIARLAEAHDVSPAMLMNRELLPRMASISEKSRTPKNATFVYQSHVMNGAGEYASNSVRVLENLTGVENVRAMTLLRFGGVLSIQHCLRTRLAWCSCCLDDWRSMGMPIYEPLLWAIEPVSCCPVHQCKLSARCPHCDRTLYILSARSRPGYCCHCQQWLGQRRTPEPGIESAFAQEVGGLLAASAGGGSFSSDLFKKNLDRCIETTADGNVNRFCIATGMSYDSGAHWLAENGRIRLELLISVCTQLGLSPLRFLSEPLIEKDFEHGRDLIHRKTSHMKKKRDQARLDEQLEKVLRATPAVSLHQVAAQLGYSSAMSLRRRNPRVCDRISERYRKTKVGTPTPPPMRAPSNGVIKRALSGALVQKPRIPLQTVARKLGFKNVVSLYNRFPDLCRAFAVANREDRARRLSRMRAEVDAALVETPPPTARELAIRLGCTDAALKYRFPELHAALLKRKSERRRWSNEPVIVLMRQASKEEPAPSARTVALRAGKSAHSLRVLNPDLFKTIKSRHREQRDLDAAGRRAAYRGEIAIAIAGLRQRGIKPSRLRVINAIPNPSMRNSHVIDELIATSLREVEASPDQITGGRY